MNRAHVDIISLQLLKRQLKARLDLGKLTGALILTVLPHRTDMRLCNKFFTATAHCIADSLTDSGVRGVQVEVVHADGLRRVEKFHRHVAVVFSKTFAAHADFADLQAGIAQLTINHAVHSPLITHAKKFRQEKNFSCLQ